MKWRKLAATSILFTSFAMAGGVMTDNNVNAEIAIDKNLAQDSIVNVTGIAEVYGDGEKIAAAVIEYPKNINPENINVTDFVVDGKNLSAVYVNDKPEITSENKIGKYVILKFDNINTAFDGELTMKPDKQGKPKGDAPMRSDRKLPNLSFGVQQLNTITAIDGTEFLPSRKIFASTSTVAPAIDAFKQFTYTDSNGNSMPYNLYLPPNYDPTRKYPLVLFIADASANINEVTTPLFQGNGATGFIDKRYPCIILAPQYTADLVDKLGMMTTDENIWTDGLTLVTNLLFDVINKYSVDTSRIYGTGQSQGGMANIAISDAYPDLFAAQLLVACQWNVDEMAILKDKHLWIVVCEGDTKAFPGMNAAVERWESLGAKVARNDEFLNSKDRIISLNRKVRELENQNANINYTVFAGGNHMYTWSFAYNITALHDWLFKQRKI